MAKKYLYAEVAKEDCQFRVIFALFNIQPLCKISRDECVDPSKCPYGKEIKEIVL